MRSNWGLLLFAAALLMATAALRAADPPADKPAKPATEPLKSEPLNLDDEALPLDPVKQPTAADRDRLEAVSLFAAGRAEEQSENYGEALKLYQRALRHDPKAQAILWQIISLARQIERPDLALRYLMLAAEKDAVDPRMLWSLGDQLTGEGKFSEALKLYQRARALDTVDRKSVVYLSLTMQVGRLAYLTGKKQEAADAFAEVLKALAHPDEYGLDAQVRKALLGDEGRTYEIFADAFLEADRPAEALKAFEHSQKLTPNAGVYAYHLARVHAAKKEYDAALEQLQAYFESHEVRDEIAPYELFEKILAEQGKQAEVLERLEKVRADDPGNVPLRYFVADKYRAAGNFAKAEPHYRDLFKQSPKLEAYRGLIEIYSRQSKPDKLLETLADAAGKLGQIDDLTDEVKKLVKDKKQYEAVLKAARAKHKERGEGFPFGDALAMALVAQQAKDFDVMNEFFELAIAARPAATGELLMTWGQALVGEEKFAEAAKVFRRGIDSRVENADEPVFHTYLAIALVMDGKVDDALVVAYDATDLGNHSAWLESRVAWILYYAKRYDEAANSYIALIKRFDDDYNQQAVRRVLREARLALSNIYVIQKNLPKAEEVLLQVLDEYPEDPGASNDLGYIWADHGKNLERSLEMIRTAVAAEPDNGAYRDSLGWALYRLGRFDEALPEMQKAIDKEDVDGTIHDHLGDVYQALGQHDKAQEAWQKSLELLEKQKDLDQEKIAQVKKKLNPKKSTKAAKAKETPSKDAESKATQK